jgi:hypothetical protein
MSTNTMKSIPKNKQKSGFKKKTVRTSLIFSQKKSNMSQMSSNVGTINNFDRESKYKVNSVNLRNRSLGSHRRIRTNSEVSNKFSIKKVFVKKGKSMEGITFRKKKKVQ